LEEQLREKKWETVKITLRQSFPFHVLFSMQACGCLYLLRELKPDVLLLYTNSAVLKKLTAPRCLFFYSMATK
jgi:hypothetical protein